jgi:hypothetical protein
MEYVNAFKGKSDRPTDAEIANTLGPAAPLWTEFVQWMAQEEGVTEQEWKGIVVKKYGWSLRLKENKRNIVYLSPGESCFMASFVLSDKALNAAKKLKLPEAAAKEIATAQRYPEGNGIRLLVSKASHLRAIRTIATVKLAN